MVKPRFQIVDEGDKTTVEVGEWFSEHCGSHYLVNELLDQTAYLAEDMLVDAVDAQEGVVERALEEPVFVATVRIPGWFVNGDDELSEEHGSMHPGDHLEMTGLVEDYSDKAWRVIARKKDEQPGLIYDYEWTFLPKSVVTLFRLIDVNSIEEADSVSKVGRAVRRRQIEEWSDMSWEEKLEEIDR